MYLAPSVVWPAREEGFVAFDALRLGDVVLRTPLLDLGNVIADKR
jgi:hypothetical protein